MSNSTQVSERNAGNPPHARMFIGGEWVDGTTTGEVHDKFDGSVISTIAEAGRDQVADAVAGVKAAFERGAPHAADRAAYLIRAAGLLEDHRDRFIDTIVAESGFTRSDAAGEVSRGIQTLLSCADEGKRLVGEMIPIGGVAGQRNRLGFTLRVPLGVICAITPFNSPLNTVLHKVAPALASGNSIVLKPASATPLTSVLLVETLLEAGVPRDFIALVHGPGGQIGRWLCEEQDIKFYAFTGSTEVGRRIQASAGLRRTQMELGSIAATILHRDANLEVALPKVLRAGYRKAGQVCTSIQRLYVHEAVFDKVKALMTTGVQSLHAGNPNDPETEVGPMIDVKEAERVEEWVREAVNAGATLLVGGERKGPLVMPVLLTNVTTDMRVMSEEVFGPLVVLRPFNRLDQAVDEINATPFGLATGVFTRDISAGIRAATRLHVGGVHINETSASRVDIMPYGGCKDSGFGREGPRYAMMEMTEERVVTVTYDDDDL